MDVSCINSFFEWYIKKMLFSIKNCFRHSFTSIALSLKYPLHITMVKILTLWELLFISIAKTIIDLARWLGTLLLFKSFISSNVLGYIFRFFSDWWLHLIFMHLTLDTGKLLTWNFIVVYSWKYYNYMVGFCRKIFPESLFDGIRLTNL